MSEKEKDEAANDEEKRDAESADDDGDDAKSTEKEDDADSANEGEGEPGDADDDGRAARVAEALGVAPEDGEIVDADLGDAEAKAEPQAPPNRAQRRREEALERRRKRKGLPAKKEGEADLSKDKNKRAKELLQRRREAASSEDDKPAQLDAGEMVDDALARGWASTTKWLRTNLQTIQWVVAGGLVVVSGYVGYTYFTQKKLGAASGLLASGALAESGYILEEDKRGEEDKELDPTPVFKTPVERADKALASYRDVQQKHPDSGAAILARLGEAGVLLDKREWDKAIEGFEAVLKTQLASADPDVKGRAIEGIGLAKEGKGDADGAAAEYRRLETIDAKGFKELSQYHQARLLLAKGTDDDRNKAKDLLKTAYDKLKEPALDKKPMPYLERSIEQALKAIDPSLIPDRDSLSGVRGGQMSQEEIQQRLRKIQEELGKKKDGDGH
ncbi:MAG: hypothetical protein IPK82_30920 [Polyangiaceae bacterium]|nr:hypothetical protein [Polyangiaceae bacterium]